jgi:hypothetical protein
MGAAIWAVGMAGLCVLAWLCGRTAKGMERPRATSKRDGQCYAPGCARDGVRWVGSLLLCEDHARTLPAQSAAQCEAELGRYG